MAKRFNITGTCIPAKHYMADVNKKLQAILRMVEDGAYFTINRPRQYGKTTMLMGITQALNQKPGYLAIRISFEGIGDDVFEDEKRFCPTFLRQLSIRAQTITEEWSKWLLEQADEIQSLEELSNTISYWVKKTDLKVVILIDEVDKSSNNQLFLSFLGVLRQKYLNSQENLDTTFHSVILAGVHDVKSLKLRLRPNEEMKYNSPWNIATDFKVDLSLFPSEIKPMLEDYAAEKNVQMDTQAIAEHLFYYTSGYPFLVSKLCKMLDEELLPRAAEWKNEDIDLAVSQLVRETNTNFESLIKNLEHHEGLYHLVFSIAIEGNRIPFNIHLPDIALGVMYGVFAQSDQLRIHNRIYQEIIYNYMSLKMQTGLQGLDNYTFTNNYVLPGNQLDMSKLALRFQAFMKEQYSVKDRDFLERQGRLIFLAFLKPILNGSGFDFKEPQISEERRLDVAITFFNHKYIIELKIWRGEAAHEAGLQQLAAYLDLQGLQEGSLIIFDHKGVKNWNQEVYELAGKKIFAVWV